MYDKIIKNSYAKINLTFEILGIMQNGFHEISSLMHKISLCDTLETTICDSEKITLVTSEFICPQEENLAYIAAKMFLSKYNEKNSTCFGANITLQKSIPAKAGLGGGSSNAACVLDSLNLLLPCFSEMEISEMAAFIGSDVPFGLCKYSFARAFGRGTELQSLPKIDKNFGIVLAKPLGDVSTALSYKYFDKYNSSTNFNNFSNVFYNYILQENYEKAFSNAINHLQEPSVLLCPEISDLVKYFSNFSPLLCQMSGSGSAVFAIFENLERANQIKCLCEKDFLGKLSHLSVCTFE